MFLSARQNGCHLIRYRSHWLQKHSLRIFIIVISSYKSKMEMGIYKHNVIAFNNSSDDILGDGRSRFSRYNLLIFFKYIV